MSSITLEHLSKQYGESFAVQGIDLSVPEGCFTALLGPSGCGKSTTLRMIAGLDSPTAGRISIGNRDVTHLPPAQRRLAMVFQSYALFPHLSVRENIVFGLKVRKEPARDHDRRLKRVADMLGLGPVLDRRPAQLSGGQQQRVALARAVISEAPVCLMDEPLSNLDAQLRHEMRREIRALQQSLGMTMVYVTHDQTEAMSMADQVVLMRAGRIEQHASPAEMYANPASVFAAGFIGTPPMNVLPLESLHDTRVLAGTHGPVVVDRHELHRLHAHARSLGVRPEHIFPANDGHAATVESVEYFGADSILIVRIGTTSGIAVRLAGNVQAQPGDTLRVRWQTEHAHFFNADGNAIR